MAQGSTGNVIAALASFFLPGLGQLAQGRFFAAIGFLLVTGLLWVFALGWIGHLLACIEAAVWRGTSSADHR